VFSLRPFTRVLNPLGKRERRSTSLAALPLRFLEFQRLPPQAVSFQDPDQKSISLIDLFSGPMVSESFRLARLPGCIASHLAGLPP
jgi:hypothetical protein